jgi:hypothetical protein
VQVNVMLHCNTDNRLWLMSCRVLQGGEKYLWRGLGEYGFIPLFAVIIFISVGA